MNEMSESEAPLVEDVRLYQEHMERIKLRIEEARRLLYKETPDERDTVYAALQLRIAIEETACASLIANRSSFGDAQRAFRLKTFKKVQRALSSVNRSYWPEAVKEVEPNPKTGAPTEWMTIEGTLSGADWIRLWGNLSEMLHMRNPWLAKRDTRKDHQFVKEVMNKLISTLNSHVTMLVGGEHLIMAQVWASPVRAYSFSQIPDSNT